MNPSYPVYIISKGRWESRYTAKTLDYMKVPYRIVVEPHEYLKYAAVINSKKILVLPFKNVGCPIPARNWVWEHSIAEGHKRHWILDDNISYFFRLNHNMKIPVDSGTIFKICEDFTDRYTNIGLSGMQYFMFASRKAKQNPFILNTRIYSCILVDNSLPLRWRGTYNADTDLSIRVLQSGLCTVLFQAFLCGKMQTMTVKGGMTDSHLNNGRLKMAESLKRQHPKLVTIKDKFGHPQHVVDYSAFKDNKLIFKKGINIKDGINNYGLELIKLH